MESKFDCIAVRRSALIGSVRTASYFTKQVLSEPIKVQCSSKSIHGLAIVYLRFARMTVERDAVEQTIIQKVVLCSLQSSHGISFA